MVKKDKRTTSSPVAPMQLQPPLKPLHIASPSVALDQRSCNAECSYEYDNLLARSRLSVRPFPPVHDLERGEDGNDGQWQVLHALDGVLCLATHRVLELVQLKRANFGFRWRDTNVERDADVPPPSCMMGPHWHLMLTTWSVFFFLSSIVNVLTFEKAGVVELGAGLILSGLCLACYALVGCSNPGIVRRIEVPPDDTYTFCDHCDSYRPEGALHCMDCRVCIEEYDHHCPWTGKCVGKGNIRYFYWWLLFLVLAFVYEVIEFTTYLLPPEGQDLLDSSDDSLEIVFPAITPTPRL
ncbi:hypothetical protein JG687_00014776 [Phytophthora cactorum]|uniref:Palmitoyltransferase n=1 Tax=Phytophthora cactorum TaxID=29920 RepID=A0A329SY57_9STRA|nr:hypothetical protein Pcac1_g18505 [Phytophthora cactorum]KAG2832320.1 hypothetical protein PC112_g6944 [Phytophthora cactorum]KAG2837637.1 hypothetical protein PC111_g4563 [Phytophthora cactorum]KAG2861824.1 hypothetical protein PC113_g6835 [Phytophthora cactorum]KAG2887355.1 hypothetical protein PC115_g20374 [Phytophthora cactorum]